MVGGGWGGGDYGREYREIKGDGNNNNKLMQKKGRTKKTHNLKQQLTLGHKSLPQINKLRTSRV